ncbi:MAG: hypothetical protein AAB407_00285 [Patescibacteria group bacterium]
MVQQGRIDFDEVTIITRLGKSWTEDEMEHLIEHVGPLSPMPGTEDTVLMIPGVHSTITINGILGHYKFDRKTVLKSEVPQFPKSIPPQVLETVLAGLV